MRRYVVLIMILFISLMAVHRTALGHGFQLSLAGNQLVASGDDYLDGKTTDPSTYSNNWVTVSLGSLYNKGAGGVQPSATGGLSVAGGDNFSLEFVSPLMYSSGGSAVPAGNSITLTANSYVSTTYTPDNLIDSVSFSGSTLASELLDVSGNSSHSIQWVLSGASIPGGVYGFAYRAHGSNGSTTYDPTTPLVILLNTGDFTDPSSVLAARAAVFAALPEPSSAGLAICAAICAAAIATIRRRAGFGLRFLSRSLMFLFALVLSFQSAAFGHGFDLSLTGNKLTAVPEGELNFSNHVFFAPLDQFNPHVYFTDHGSVEAVSGIDPSHDTLQIQFLSPLWYSSGGVAQRASSDLTLEATSYDSFGGQLGNPVDITGTSVNPGSFPISGDDAHSIGWELFNSTSAPAIGSGAYGVAYEVKGYKNGDLSMPFQTSEPLVVVFNTPTFTGGSLSSAQFAVYRAIMRGNFNLDGGRSSADLSAMLGAFSNLSAYQSSHGLLPGDIQAIADVNQDGAISNADIQSLLNVLKNGGGAASGVPEPSSWLLICSGLLIFRARRWRK